MRFPLLFSILLILCSCTQPQKKVSLKRAKKPKIEVTKPCTLEDSLSYWGLVNIQDIDSNIKVNLRYSGLNNFLKTDLYQCLQSAYLQKDVAKKLSVAQNELTKIDSNLHLLIWDAVRPRSIQRKMWNSLKMPFQEKVRYVSNPRNGSIHNYGCAVDLTICRKNGTVLDMGTDFDHFGTSANINAEWKLLMDEVLEYTQIDNRKLLRKVMKNAGFSTISSEWWHFNSCSRCVAKTKYRLIE